jgi:hypothetical protein
MPAPAWSIPAKPGLRAPRHERRRGTSGAAPSLRLGNEREALEDLEEIYELNPGYRDVARLLERETEASTDV